MEGCTWEGTHGRAHIGGRTWEGAHGRVHLGGCAVEGVHMGGCTWEGAPGVPHTLSSCKPVTQYSDMSCMCHNR